MIKLLLIDDEFYFRQYLKTCIDWEALGCRLVGEASDGQEGFAILKEKKPEIVLLDINMPLMDGIEFSRQVFLEKIETKLIILSGHSEFQYAQQAMKYGVKSYLLKPLDEEELCQTILRIGEEIQEHRDRKERLKELEKRQKPILEATMVNDLAHGRLPEKKGSSIEKERFYMVLALEVEGGEWKKWNREEEELWFYAIKNVSREIIPDSIDLYFGKDGNGRLLCLLESQESLDKMESRGRLWAMKLTDFVFSYFPFRIDAGIGSKVKGMAEIQDSYKQAVFSLKNKFISSKEKVLEYEKARSSVSENMLLNSERRNEILIYLRQGNLKKEEELISEIFRTGRLRKLSYDMLQCHCTEFIFLCLEFLEEKGLVLKEVFPEHSSPLQCLEDIHTIEDAEQEILKLYHRIFEYMEIHRNSRNLRYMEEMKRYIENHCLQQEFKISDVSDAFHINYHYLCHSFKQQMGMTINQYVTWFRIEQAKRRMESGICNLTLLAEQVGYSDLGYFGKCFKKQTGISPSQYLEQMDKKINEQNYQ